MSPFYSHYISNFKTILEVPVEAMDLTIPHPVATCSQLAVCHNIPQDLSLRHKDESVDNMKIPDDVSLDAPVHDDGSCNSDYFTGPGIRTHWFRTYSAKIQIL